MKKTIRYLENGEYHYATVKDVGDIAKLKTDSKDDLVAAINELYLTGGTAKPVGYDDLVKKVTDNIEKQQDIDKKVDDVKKDSEANKAEVEELVEEQKRKAEELRQSILRLNQLAEKASQDAKRLEDNAAHLQDDIDKKFNSVSESVKQTNAQLDNSSKQLQKELSDTKQDLENAKSRLQNNESGLDANRQQIQQAETELEKTKTELKSKASAESLGTVTQSVEKLDAQVKHNAKGLEVAVKRDELSGNVASLLRDKTNLLLGTRNFAGDYWTNNDVVELEPGYYKGLKVASTLSSDKNIYQKYPIKAKTPYTFSFYAKQDKENQNAVLSIFSIDKPNVNIDNPKQTIHIGEDWQRFAVTFMADLDCIIGIEVTQGNAIKDNKLYTAGFMLQFGEQNTNWEPNEKDVAENIEHTEAQFKVHDDKIEAVTKRQEQIGSQQTEQETRITQNAEGVKQNSKELRDTNGKIVAFEGKLESTAKGLKTEFQKETQQAIGQISDSSLNLIRNSSFSNRDSNFDQWQNVSEKANIREDENGLRWVELTQTGLSSDNPIGLTSNYFEVKQGKVTVAVDVKDGGKAALDNPSVLFIELYDKNKKRVDFQWVNLTDLGLSVEALSDHLVHRGMYRKAIDRADVKFMTLKAHIMRNGDMWFTNFSAKLSSIDDGAYVPNPEDLNQQVLKQNTKLEQNAREIALRATSTEVKKTVNDTMNKNNGGGVNLQIGTKDCSFEIGTNGNPSSIETYGSDTKMIHTQNGGFYTAYSKTSFVPTPGEFYTLSADVKGDGKISGSGFRYEGGNNGTMSEVALSDNWQRIVNTVHIDRVQGQWVIYPSGMKNLYVKHLKIERGTIATPWTPAPEDAYTTLRQEIKSSKDAAIQVASDNVQIKVNELSTTLNDTFNQKINEAKEASQKFTSDGIEQTVKKITDVQNNVNSRIDNIQIGGRNLVQNGDANDARSPWVNTKFEKHPFYYNGSKRMYNLYTSGKDEVMATNNAWFPVIAGHQYTLSFKGFMSTNVLSYDVWLLGKKANTEVPNGEWSNSCNIINGQRLSAAHTDTVVKTFTVPSDWDNFVAFIRFDNNGSTDGQNSVFFFNEVKLERGNKATDWTPAPEDIEERVNTQTLETADIDAMRAEGHFFVHNLTGNPTSGWVYVDVSGNGLDRIRQDVYQDSNSSVHFHRKLFGVNWTPWEKEATQTDINNLRTETTASVKNLGDRVTTEVNSITTQMNDGHSNDVELIRKSDFSDGNKGSWAGDLVTVVSGNNIPPELGQDGMKVLRTAQRDTNENAIWYSVRPGEIFDVDYWIWPTGEFECQLGLYFVDAPIKNSVWRGVVAKKGTGWVHYIGTIQAPPNAAFAKPWIQINKDANEKGSAAWIAKPSIRRHDNQIDKKIQEVNTRLDVANGQILARVEEIKTTNFGGGVNLQVGTQDCSLTVSGNGTPVTVEGYDSDTKMFHATRSGMYTGWVPTTFVPTPGESYTISADFKGNGTISGSGFRYEGGNNGTLSTVTLTDKWQRISNTVKVDKVQGQWVFYPSGATDFYVKHIKIERGTVATPWSPSPLDAVQKSNLISEFNLQAGQALIKSNRIVLDADTVDVGRIKGKDLDINLNEGSVNFEHGVIKTTDNLFGIDLDKGIVHGGKQINDPGYVAKRRQEVMDRANDLRDKAQKKDVLAKRERNEKIGNLPFAIKGKWTTIIDDKNIVQGSNSSDNIVYRPISNNIEKDTFWESIDNTMLNGSGKVRITIKANLANSNVGRYDSALVFIMSAMSLPSNSSINLFTLKEKGIYENTISIPKGTTCTINNLKQYGLTFITQKLGANEKLTIDELKVEVYSEALVKDLDSPEGKKIQEEYEKVQREVMALGDKAQQIEKDFDNGPAPIQYEGFSLDKEGLRVSADGDETVIANGKIITNNAEITGGHIDVSGAMDYNYGFSDKKFIETSLRLADGGLSFKTKDTNASKGYNPDAIIGLIATPSTMSSLPDTQLNISSNSMVLQTYVDDIAKSSSVIELHGDTGKLASGFSINSFDGKNKYDHTTPRSTIYGAADGSMGIKADNIKVFGAIDMSNAPLRAIGADHGIRNVWVSWSGWDGGEKYPALVNDTSNWGGIAFPKSGRVTLFDASGHYYCPDRNTGLGVYDNYMGKNGQWQ